MPALQQLSPQETLKERIRDTNKRLSTEFSGFFSEQDVQRYVEESLNAYQGVAVLDFVPLFVERATRERLRAAASTAA